MLRRIRNGEPEVPVIPKSVCVPSAVGILAFWMQAWLAEEEELE